MWMLQNPNTRLNKRSARKNIYNDFFFSFRVILPVHMACIHNKYVKVTKHLLSVGILWCKLIIILVFYMYTDIGLEALVCLH